MAGEGEFPKTGGDWFYATDLNWLFGRGLFSFTRICNNYYDNTLHTPLDDDHIVGITGDTRYVYRSEDAGKTYAVTSLYSMTTYNLEGIYGPKDGSGYMFVWDGARDIFYSHDFGVTFTQASSVDSMRYYRDVDAPSQNLFIISGGADISGTTYPAVLRSTDGGDTWQRVYLQTTVSGEARGVSMYDDNYGFCVGRGSSTNLWKTTDGGATWTEITTGDSLSTPSHPYGMLATGPDECYVFTHYGYWKYDGTTITYYRIPIPYNYKAVTKIGDVWYILQNDGSGHYKLFLTKDLETFYGRNLDYNYYYSSGMGLPKHRINQTENYLWIQMPYSFLYRINKSHISNIILE